MLSASGGIESPPEVTEPAIAAGHYAKIRLVAADMQGNPIASVQVGQKFQVEEFVSDTSANPQGVFAMYNDWDFNDGIARLNSSVTFPDGAVVTVANSTAHGFLDAGAIRNMTLVGGVEQILFTTTFTAIAVGRFSISTAPDPDIGGDILEFGTDDSLPASHVDFGTLDLSVNAAQDGSKDSGTNIVPVDSTSPVHPTSWRTHQLNDVDRTAGIRLVATDLEGNPITSIQVGQSFLVEEFVNDTSAAAQGVFSAYNELIFDSDMAALSQPLDISSSAAADSATDSSQVVLSVGSLVAYLQKGTEQRLFTATFTARSAGSFSISTAFDGQTGHEFLETDHNDAIPASKIDFGTLTLTINGPSNDAASAGTNPTVPVPGVESQTPVNSTTVVPQNVSNLSNSSLMSSQFAAISSAINIVGRARIGDLVGSDVPAPVTVLPVSLTGNGDDQIDINNQADALPAISRSTTVSVADDAATVSPSGVDADSTVTLKTGGTSKTI